MLSIAKVKTELSDSIANLDKSVAVLKTELKGMQAQINILQWVIGGIGAGLLLIAGTLVSLLVFFFKQVWPYRITGNSEALASPTIDAQQEETEQDKKAPENTHPDYQPISVERKP